MSVQKIEEAIRDSLKGNAQKNALDFAAYLRTKEIPIEDADTYWEIKYQGECVCFLWINGAAEIPGPWTIWSAQVPGTWAVWDVDGHGSEIVDVPIDDHIKALAWANVNVCGNCGGCENPGGRYKTVLGKGFDHLCNSTMAFTDPDAETLDCAKKMVDMRIADILKGR